MFASKCPDTTVAESDPSRWFLFEIASDFENKAENHVVAGSIRPLSDILGPWRLGHFKEMLAKVSTPKFVRAEPKDRRLFAAADLLLVKFNGSPVQQPSISLRRVSPASVIRFGALSPLFLPLFLPLSL